MLENVKNSCKNIMSNSKYVKINYKKLDKYIENIDYTNIKHWLISNPYNLLELPIDTIINFLLLFESINYSFWGNPKWTINTKDEKKDGSDALLYAMLNYIRKENNLDFTKVTIEKFRAILKGNIEIPLLNERYLTLYNISELVNKKMNGNFYNYIKNLTDDRKLFQFIIDNFNSFKDEREYCGENVYFYKLAQLLTSDILHLRELIEGIHVDYSHLVGCADYKIPQTMRALGIIEYSNELAEIIDNSKEIEINSKYEIEIRASMITVINYIKEKIKKYNSIDINDYFFMESKKVKGIAKPYHLCRNTNY